MYIHNAPRHVCMAPLFLYKAPHGLPNIARVSANTENSSSELSLPSRRGSRVIEEEKCQRLTNNKLRNCSFSFLACVWEALETVSFSVCICHNGRPVHGAPLGIRLRPPRQRHLLHDLHGSDTDVLPHLQEQVDGGLPVGTLRGGALQLDAVDLLRHDQVQRGAPHHYQRRRLRHRDHLHRHVPRLRPEEGKDVHRQDHAPRQRWRVRAHPPPHPPPLLRREAHRLARLDLRRLLRQRLRRATQHHQACDPDKERGVHALLPLPLAHPQRRRLVPLRPPYQGQIRRASQRSWVRLRRGPDGYVRVLHEQDAGGRGGQGGRQARGGGAGGAHRRQHRQAQPRRPREELRAGAPVHRDGDPQDLRGRGGGGRREPGRARLRRQPQPRRPRGLDAPVRAWPMHTTL